MFSRDLPRRWFLHMGVFGLLLSRSAAASAAHSTQTVPRDSPPAAEIAALAARAKGRLGFCIHDSASRTEWGNLLDERFALCSTFKLPLVAAILQQVDQGRLQLQQVVPYSQADVVPHAPVTLQHLARGSMTLVALMQAAQQQSDNVAANLLLRLLGGPAGFTAILRGWGDRETRLDRSEPMMNLVLPGEQHDTTTPRAMARTASRILCSDLLSAASRSLLVTWMQATATGEKRIRAGLPKEWRAGDKTGTGMAPRMTNKYNDVAIAWPTERAPLIITAYYDTATIGDPVSDADQALLADVGRLAARWVAASR